MSLPSTGRVEGVCAAGPDEANYAASVAPARGHRLVFSGLLADTAYSCRVVDGQGRQSLPLAVRTDPLPEGIPAFDAVGTPTGAYHLFNLQRGAAASADHGYVVVVDALSRVRWWYDIGPGKVVDIDAQWTGEVFHFGGGWAHLQESARHRGVFLDVDVEGNVVLERSEPAFGLGYNHHSERLSDGSTLSLTFSDNAADGDTWFGVGVEQWHPTRGLLWTFDSQALIDAGQQLPPPVDFRSPYHANAVHFVSDAQGDAAWVSLYARRQLWRIDRASGLRTHAFGVAGDMTLLDLDGAVLDQSEWPWVQHDPDYTQDGRILLHDNGAGRPGGVYSRVAEYTVDLERNEARLVWFWTEPGWFNPVLGDADWLANGNVLIARGFNQVRTPESDDVSQILEIVPPNGDQAGEVVWRLRFSDPEFALFRAQQLGGCDLFANAATCDAAAAAIEAAFGGMP